MDLTAISYTDTLHRLALGVELVDPARQQELVHPVRVDIEQGIPHFPAKPRRRYSFIQTGGDTPAGLTRHDSGRYSLRYHAGIQNEVDLRIYDHDRYYVPRRLRVPLMSLEDVLEIEENENSDFFIGRVRHPVLFPGAAYDVASLATGLRGRVMRGENPMRWAYVEARLAASNALVGRARGDDRGEFLLLLQPEAAPASELTATLAVRVSIAGPAVAPTPATVDLPAQDFLWDLPLEVLPLPGFADDVSAGTALPAGYITPPSATRDVAFPLGRLLTGVEEADFNFVP